MRLLLVGNKYCILGIPHKILVLSQFLKSFFAFLSPFIPQLGIANSYSLANEDDLHTFSNHCSLQSCNTFRGKSTIDLFHILYVTKSIWTPDHCPTTLLVQQFVPFLLLYRDSNILGSLSNRLWTVAIQMCAHPEVKHWCWLVFWGVEVRALHRPNSFTSTLVNHIWNICFLDYQQWMAVSLLRFKLIISKCQGQHISGVPLRSTIFKTKINSCFWKSSTGKRYI